MKEVVVYNKQVNCSGEKNDHPKVYYTIGKDGYVICGYCNIKYVYEGNDDWWDKIPHRVRDNDWIWL